jgi:vacuolar-type H+-ATPase catalytic subunit A/Vma1
LSSTSEKIPLRRVPHGLIFFPLRSSFAHSRAFLIGLDSNMSVACIKTIMYVGFTLARQTRIATVEVRARMAWP